MKHKFLYFSKKTGLPVWLVITILMLLPVRILLPQVGLAGINWALKNKMGAYDGKVEDFDLSLYRGAYQLQGLEIRKKNSELAPLIKIDQIDLSIAWRSLLNGEVNADLHLTKAVVNLTDSEKKEKRQTGLDEPKWRDALDVIVPVNVESLKIENSSIYFTNPDIDKAKPLQIEKINASIENLRSRKETSDTLSPLNATALLQDHAAIKITGVVDALAKEPRFDLNASLINFHPKNLNQLMLKYVPLDLTKGEISVYSEVAGSGGEILGYAKVFLKDVDVIAPDQRLQSGKHFLFELGSAFANWILQNHSDRTVAAHIPFTRSGGKFDIDSSEAFWSAIKNMNEELKRGFDNSINLKIVEKKKDNVSRR